MNKEEKQYIQSFIGDCFLNFTKLFIKNAQKHRDNGEMVVIMVDEIMPLVEKAIEISKSEVNKK